MGIPTKEQERIMRELAPYFEEMTEIHDNFLGVQLRSGRDEDESRSSATLLAVMSGLSISRRTSEVKEKVENIIFVQEMFEIYVTLRKMLRLGIIEGQIEGVDEYGWPAYHVVGVNEEWRRYFES